MSVVVEVDARTEAVSSAVRMPDPLFQFHVGVQLKHFQASAPDTRQRNEQNDD